MNIFQHQLRALVVGGGSIGLRHLKNLYQLQVTDLTVVEPKEFKVSSLGFEVSVFKTIPDALSSGNFDFAVIASPSQLHLEQGLLLARENIHLFIEKPLSVSSSGIAELIEETAKHELTTIVGCNMRFHPGPLKVKEILETNAIGKVLSANFYSGSYLPEWRTTDYRNSYSASKTQGGGCLLDCIHEIDLAMWLLGGIKNIYAQLNQLSGLEISAEDAVHLVAQHESEVISTIALNYFERTYQRNLHLVGDQGSLFWDINGHSVKLYEASSRSWREYPQPQKWDLNQMYVDEMAHFLSAMRSHSETCFSVKDAYALMRVIEAIQSSAQLNQRVDVGKNSLGETNESNEQAA